MTADLFDYSYCPPLRLKREPEGTDGLPEPFPPAQRHSETSKQAALAALPRAPTDRARVLAYLVERGAYGATDDEMQNWLGMNPSTQRPRRVELWKAGLIVLDTRKRLTRAGRKASVWVAA